MIEQARNHAIDLEQCALVVDSPPLAKAMTDAAKFLRSLSAAVPASGGVEAVARERADIARLADELALNARLERAGEKATSVGSTGAICMSIGAESMAKTIARSIRERASLSPAPTSGAVREAAQKALNYIENTESELGITLSCGDALRAALPAPASSEPQT